ENVIVSRPKPRVALITPNRPKVLSVLNAPVTFFNDIASALKDADSDTGFGGIFLTDPDRAFAGPPVVMTLTLLVKIKPTKGCNLKEMKDKSLVEEAYTPDFLAGWQVIANPNKPVITAVTAYALGGGLELALQADVLLAATGSSGDHSGFGVIPGGGAPPDRQVPCDRDSGRGRNRGRA
ncbi:hypothetical protein BS17DRAFT_861257, partial [Gyrodon lividus]